MEAHASGSCLIQDPPRLAFPEHIGDLPPLEIAGAEKVAKVETLSESL